MRQKCPDVFDQFDAILATVVADIQSQLSEEKNNLEVIVREMENFSIESANEMIQSALDQNQGDMIGRLISGLRDVM